MYLGAQIPLSEDNLAFLQQMGVTHVDPCPGGGLGMGLGIEEEGAWRRDALERLRDTVERRGLTLAAMHLPLSSAGIEHQIWPNIMLGRPERDRDIEQVCRCIRAAGQAGIPLLLYNLAVLPVVRTRPGVGRGGLRLSRFDSAELADDTPLPTGRLLADEAWERIDYFLKRVIPVAEEYAVRLGCHQHDPAMPPGKGYRGVQRVLGSVEGVRRFLDLYPSAYHGLNFCQGTVAEMCRTPEEVYAAIRTLGADHRIFWVHFRNIRGGFLCFEEVLPDEGDVDMLRALRTYREVGYDGVLIPDHVPHSPQDTPYGHRAHAFCYGYIRALLQTLEEEPAAAG